VSVVIAVLSVVAAAVFLLAGTQKVLLSPRVTTNMRRLGVGRGLIRVIGVLEIAGAVGLIAGIWFPVLGIAAAVGFVCLLHGALVYHARAGDFSHHGRRAEALAPGVLLMIVTGLTGALLMSVL
jgi:uncharacterized membrane protein YphA (DoxX/SURF4 family)